LLKAKGFSPRALVDVGAAQGVWTKQMLSLYPDSSYLMIDPLEENEPLLQALSGAHQNVKYWLGAAGRTAGELNFHVHGDQSSMYDSQWGKEGKQRRVQMRTLDRLVKEFGVGDNLDGLKLDVQGAELEVLAGAADTLKQCKVVQVEVSFRRVYEKAPLAHELIRFFAEQGFRIFDISTLYKRKDYALLQADIFFVSDDKLFEPEKWDL